MTDPMSPEELRACRERAEAATAGPLFAGPDGDGGYGTFTPHGLRQYAEAHTAFAAHARTDVPRLLATLDAAQRETASLRHAALLAAGIHGGPGAWRWASDPTGTTLDDVAAWERLLGEMREVTRQREERSAKRAAEEEKRAAYRLKVIREGYCMADRDGDCGWEDCPQTADGEPAKSGRHCPRDDDAHSGDR